MKPRQSTKDKIKGAVRTVSGKVKKHAGRLTGDRDLAAEGKGEEVGGRLQRKVGQAERVLEKD